MKKVLIVVDMQQDFVYNMEVLGSEHAQKIVPNVVEKVKKYIREHQHVIFTKDYHNENYLETREGKHLPIPHCIYGSMGYESSGIELVPELNILLETNHHFVGVVYKKGFGMELDALNIRDKQQLLNADEIEIIGVATNLCVISNAIIVQNFNRKAELFIDASCCASYDPVLHEKALDVLEGLQFNVINR